MSDQERFDKILEKLDTLEDKTERTWRAIVGDPATRAKGLGERMERNENDIASLKKDRTKAGVLISAALMILGAFGAKIIEYLKS